MRKRDQPVSDHEVYKPRGLLVLLALAIVVGILSLGSTVRYGQAQQQASREDVEANRAIIERVEKNQQEIERLAIEQKQLIYELCEKAVQIAKAANITTDPCS